MHKPSSSHILGPVLLVGYGREGQSTHRYLLRQDSEIQIEIFDDRKVKPIPEAQETPYHNDRSFLDNLDKFKTVIRSPGFVLPSLNHVSGQLITSATNIFFDRCPGKIIGVTGTKGKSTTSSLTAALLSCTYADVRLAGNIGKPMLDSLKEANADTIFVLELSSFQLEDLIQTPDVAILLDIVPEHLDHHKNFESYSAAKSRITVGQTNSDLLIFNPESRICTKIAGQSVAIKLMFSRNEETSESKSWLSNNALWILENNKPKKLIDLSNTKLRGMGNISNMLAAVTCASAFGVPSHLAADVLSKFSPLPHRLEEVGNYRGIRFINDSLSTIPQALCNAIESYGAEVQTLIAGGYDRGIDYSIISSALTNSRIETFILFPTTGDKIWEAVVNSGTAQNCRRIKVENMEDAVSAAYAHTSPGRICLLSPAASSFNLFKDYQERGDSFKLWVEKLASKVQYT